MSRLSRVVRKLQVWSLYAGAEKIKGFQVRVTGDIDDPEKIDMPLLREWARLASQLGTTQPILYVTVSRGFKGKQLESLLPNVEVGIHGARHIHYSYFSHDRGDADLHKQAKLCGLHRFPFLDYNVKLLKIADKLFQSDSSVVNSRMHPFKIGNMTEYPITPPTDTALRDKPVTEETVALFKGIIEKARQKDRYCTLLLHPNSWSTQLIQRLLYE